MRDREFTEFFKEYYPLLRAYCIARFSIDAYDAEDYASDAFGELWRHWDRFEYSTPSARYAWLCKRVRSRFIDDYRRKKRMPVTQICEARNYEEIPDIEGEAEDEAYREYIAEIKSRLGERETEIFEMMVERSLSIDETARELGIGKPATLTAWYRLRKKLEGILKEIF